MSAPDRASWIAALRTVLAIAEAHPEIRLPDISVSNYGSSTASWYLYGDGSARHLAALERALPCELTARSRRTGDGRDRYELSGDLPGGIRVEVSADAEAVAERKVTGTVTTDVVEWVRKPAAPQAAEGEEQS